MTEQNNKELHIISENGTTIFSKETKYVIPLYQRAFAWKEKQLVQLIEDVSDISADSGNDYYLGTLIVAKKDNAFEVIDGQQRLTALYLLLSVLEQTIEKDVLTFECRDNSNYTLNNIQTILTNDRSGLDTERIEPGIWEGLEILKNTLRDELKNTDKKVVFLEKLKKVVLFCVEVPERTDLNHYFEIMNTRGEQLEQHDILKAKLMGYIGNQNRNDETVFASIWDACSDMTGYVQMHFEPEIRKNLFGSNWGNMPPKEWQECESVFFTDEKGNKEEVAENNANESDVKKEKQTIDKIIANPPERTADGKNEADYRVRFESIIDFPYFLLHALKVFVIVNDIKIEKDISLDDKKLLGVFDTVANSCEDNGEFSRKFIVVLLKTRFLFDKYIIKREYLLKDEYSDGEWSLKTLLVSDNKPYYANTEFIKKQECKNKEKNIQIRAEKNKMIQSALRVSYTSPKSMHWITNLLKWLMEQTNNGGSLDSFANEAEKIAKKAVKKDFFEKCRNNVFDLGVGTPHIVFNYLDYLLWKKDKYEDKNNYYKEFVFEFRNSVEHWYPQNPVFSKLSRWDTDNEGGVDRFGNLCLIQRQLNSRFSNLDPEAKKDQYVDNIDKGSIKLRIMREKTVTVNGRRGSIIWKEEECKKHEDEMISILKNACNESDTLPDSAEN